MPVPDYVPGVALMPHPPVAVPDVGRSSTELIEATALAMREVASLAARSDPELLIVISPHGSSSASGVTVCAWEDMNYDLARFGAPNARVSFTGDIPLARILTADLGTLGVEVRHLDSGSGPREDHGSTVPLIYMRRAGVGARLLVINGINVQPNQAVLLGRAISDAVSRAGRRAFYIISGDLSHRLTPDAPAGYDPMGRAFDAKVTDLLAQGDAQGILTLDRQLVQRAGECGYLPICAAMGVVDGRFRSRILSYEGPFGVGYAVALIYPGEHNGALYTDLAAAAVARALRDNEQYGTGFALPPELLRRSGAFVTIRRHGLLRGCIGTVHPLKPTLADEIAVNAIAAATRDGRFHPLERHELDSIEISVDVIGPLERIPGPRFLDPAKYGVVVEQAGRTALLLPDLEGIDTVSEQVSAVLEKAGIASCETEISYQRFVVERYGEGERD